MPPRGIYVNEVKHTGRSWLHHPKQPDLRTATVPRLTPCPQHSLLVDLAKSIPPYVHPHPHFHSALIPLGPLQTCGPCVVASRQASLPQREEHRIHLEPKGTQLSRGKWAVYFQPH